MSRQDAGELVVGREVVQLFHAQGEDLACVSPIIATYQRAVSGTLLVSLYRATSEAQVRHYLAPLPPPPLRTGLWDRLTARFRPPPAPVEPGTKLAELALDCARATDNETVDFVLSPIVTAPGDLLVLRLRPVDTQAGSGPTIWLSDSGERIPGHVACYIQGQDQGSFGIQATTFYGGVISELSVPEQVLYSPVTQCNYNCIHCISQHTRGSVNTLATPIKQQLRDWCATGKVGSITTDHSGDILWVETRFGGELDFLFSLDVPLHINTNGACLTAEISERLCRLRLMTLNVSLDAADPATYARIRKGSSPLAEVVANIEGLMRARAASGANFTISTSIALMRSNLREWPDFVRMGARLGVDFIHARHLEAYSEDMEAESLWHDRAAYNAARLEALALAESLGIEIGAPAPFGDAPVAGRRPCSVPWQAAAILGNGDVQACCIPGTVMGNLNESTMEEIWNGEHYQALRRTVNSANPTPVCAACPMFRRTDNPDSYLIYSATKRLAAARPAA